MTRSTLDPLMEMTRRGITAALTAARKAGVPFFIVDATAGNGHDTLFLAHEAGETGRVFAFDVQASAIVRAEARIDKAGLSERVAFIHAGHETAANVLSGEADGQLWAATFNLGYLPGSDKAVVTDGSTTITALSTLTRMAAQGCVISVHTYRGHDGGETEFQQVGTWLRELPWEEWRVAEYSFINKIKNKETLFLLEKV